MTSPTPEPNGAMARLLASAAAATQDSNRDVLRAVRLAFGRSAQQTMGLTLSVIGAKQARLGQGDIAEVLPQGWLALLLDGPDAQSGAICFSPDLVAGMVQHQTIGKVTGAPVEDRPFTATDAALVAPVVQHMLDQLTEHDDQAVALVAGFDFGAAVRGAQDLMLALSVEWYTQIALTVELAGGVVQGQALLLFPEVSSGEGDAVPAQGMPHGPTLEVAFDVTRADLRTVLCQLRMPVAELLDLSPGDLLPLPIGSFTRTELRSVAGELIAVGRLGQINGQRALRVNETQIAEMEDQGATLPVPQTSAPPAPTQSPEQGSLLVPEKASPSSADLDHADQGVIEHDTEELTLEKSGDDLAAEISRLAGLSDIDPWEPTDAAPTG